MTTTIDRPPLYTRVPPPDYSRALVSQPLRGSDLLLELTQPVQAPLVTFDWPNPQIPRWNVDLRTWLQDPLPTLIVVQPATGIAWLDTPDRRYFQQPFDVVNFVVRAPTAPQPAVNNDQPNPTAWYVDRYAGLRGFLNYNINTQPPNPGAPLSANFPFNGANPMIPRFPQDMRGFTGQLNALSISPPPVGTTAKWRGLHIGMRNGL